MLGFLLHALLATAQTQTPYNIRLYESFLPFNIAHSLAESQSSNTSYQYHYVGNDSYLCELPAHVPPLPQPSGKPDAAVLASAVDLIQSSFSSDSCVWAYDLRRSYWTYAFCNGDKIIQYHEAAPLAERGKTHLAQMPNHVFVLGRFQKSSSHDVLFENQASPASYEHYVNGEARRTATLKEEQSSPFSHSSAQKVVSQIVTDGSMCDMTGQPRTIEVVYKCDSSLSSKKPQIVEVSEIKVCHYKMLIHIPKLCTHEAFIPDKYVQDHLVNVNCQRVDPENLGVGSFLSFDGFLNKTVLRIHPAFPVRADNRINIADHHLVPLNRGFYIARSKTNPTSESEYFNQRNVILFNGFYETLSDLNVQFARAMINSIGTKLLAPIAIRNGAGEVGLNSILEWSHTFVLFFEIYDYKGELVGISKISHDASRGERAISAAILDPDTLLDNEGDEMELETFARPDFEAPMEMWNFQVFDEHGKPLKKKHMGSVQDATVSRLLIVHNRGWENNRVKMEVVDEQSGSVLPGGYTGENEYSFVLEGPRESVEYKIKPIEAYQEFYGFRVEVRDQDAIFEGGESSEGEHVDAQDRLSEVLKRIIEESTKRFLIKGGYNREGEGEGEEKVAEGKGEKVAEGKGEKVAEGKGEKVAEGKGEKVAEGKGEKVAEGKGEEKVTQEKEVGNQVRNGDQKNSHVIDQL